MSTNKKYTDDRTINGMDQRLQPAPKTAGEVNLFRVDKNLGWINDVGWEPLISLGEGGRWTTDAYTPTVEELLTPYRFLSIWPRHQSAEVYYMYEKNGKLEYEWGNKGGATTRTVTLATGRKEPKADDPGTQLIPFGRLSILINGTDGMITFWGREKILPFGFNMKPSAPTVYTPQPSAAVGSALDSGNTYMNLGTGTFGVGTGTNPSTNVYGYRVAFLSSTGSIGPVSEPTFIRWSVTAAGQVGKQAVLLKDIPLGPENTVARIIYRTYNKSDGLTNLLDNYYEVGRIRENVTQSFIDTIPDNFLAGTPIDLDGSIPIDQSWKYGTEFDGRVWLAGGTQHPTRIIWSGQRTPEQFAASNYFELGSTTGGHITGLKGYYNLLVVFRERSIDIITKDNGQYNISTLDGSIGTTATNTIREVPGKGLFFLSKDGVYAIAGALSGGSQYRLVHISEQLTEEWERLSTTCLPRATAVYSHKEKEYWVHYPTDGGTENSRGAVYHLETGGWSIRNTEGYANGEMTFTHFAVDPTGYIIMAPWLTRPFSIETYEHMTEARHSFPGIGLQVWSRAPYMGNNLIFDSAVLTPGEGTTYKMIEGKTASAPSVFESIWDDFGNSYLKKNIAEVVINGLTQGNNPIPMEVRVDQFYEGQDTPTVISQQAEFAGSPTEAQFVMSPVTNPRAAVWGDGTVKQQGVWEASRRVDLTFNPGQAYCSMLKWRIETSNYVHILSYKLGYTVNGTKSTNSN